MKTKLELLWLKVQTQWVNVQLWFARKERRRLQRQLDWQFEQQRKAIEEAQK